MSDSNHIYSAQSENLFRELTTIIRKVFEREDLEVTGRTSAADVPEWDSFKMIEILMEVESKYSITMDTRDMDSVNTVADLALCIRDKLDARHNF
jgi:acyl carrier protein